MAGFTFPSQPPRAVRDYLANKKLKPSFDWQDVWKQEHQVAFTVAKATQLDVLQDIYDELLEAVNNGQTFQSFRQQLTPRLVEKGWWGKKEMTDPATGEIRQVQLGVAVLAG